jgi:CBS-domain-containing membrane protein
MDVDLDTTRLLVADVMTIDPVVVAVDATIEEAARLLHEYVITGLPVIDESGGLVGVISQTDLVGALDSPVGRLIRTRPSGFRVGDLMSSPAVTIPLTGSVQEAARLMVDSRIHRLVATDDAGGPVGVLSALDLVKLVIEA